VNLILGWSKSASDIDTLFPADENAEPKKQLEEALTSFLISKGVTNFKPQSKSTNIFCNIAIDLIDCETEKPIKFDLNYSKAPIGSRHRTLKDIVEININKECIIYPKYSSIRTDYQYSSFKEFADESDSGWIECSEPHLSSLSGVFTFFLGELSRGILAEDLFIEKLYEKLFSNYLSDKKNFSAALAVQMKKFFKKHILNSENGNPKSHYEACLTIGLNMVLLAFESYGSKKCHEVKQQFFKEIWSVIHKRINKYLDSASKNSLVYQLLKPLDTSIECFIEMREYLLALVYLFFAQKHSETILEEKNPRKLPSIIQIHDQQERGIHFSFPLIKKPGSEKWSSLVILVPKITKIAEIAFEALLKNGLGEPLSMDEIKFFSSTNKQSKLNLEIGNLSHYLNLKNEIFNLESIKRSHFIEKILVDWKHFLINSEKKKQMNSWSFT
jgi:hypothetical protein